MLKFITRNLSSFMQLIVSYLTAWTGFDALTSGFLTSEQNGYMADNSVSFKLIFICILLFMLLLPHLDALRYPVGVLSISATLAVSMATFLSQSHPRPTAPEQRQTIDFETAKALLSQDSSKAAYLAKLIDTKPEGLSKLIRLAGSGAINDPYNGLTPLQRAMRSGDLDLVKQLAGMAEVRPDKIGNSWRISQFNYVPFMKNWGTDNVDYALKLENKEIAEHVVDMAIRQDYVFNTSQIGKMIRLGLPEKLVSEASARAQNSMSNTLNTLFK